MRSLIAALTGLFLCLSSAQADSQVSLFETMEPSVGALFKRHDDGSMQFMCSVTAIDTHDGMTVFLTAFHCVRRNTSYAITMDGLSFTPAFVHSIPGYELDSDEYPRGYQEPEADIATFTAPIDAPLQTVADGGARPTGHPVAMMGFPLGQAKLGSTGIVSGTYDRLGEDIHGYLALQIFGAPGSSGSAVIDLESGEIVAVLSQASQARAGLPNIWAVPVDYLDVLVEVPSGREVGAEGE